MDSDDDTADALAALRGFDADREAEEAAERAAVAAPAAEQAALALSILDDWQRRWTIEDRWALGLPTAADHGDWHETVERRLGELDDAAVIDGWLRLVERDAAPRRTDLRSRISATLAQLPTLAPFVERIDRALRRPSSAARDALREAAAHATAEAPELIEVLRGILRDQTLGRRVADGAVGLASAWSRHSLQAAALIAARARIDRVRSRTDARARVPLEERTTVLSSVLASAVRDSGCERLIPTALLEMESWTYHEYWARALLAIAGDFGRQYVTRMRGRPGWSAHGGEAPEVPADPLVGLTSPLDDVRCAALRALADRPRAEHVQALLLGLELERFIRNGVYRERGFDPWRGPQLTAWIPQLRAAARSRTSTDRFADEYLAGSLPGHDLLGQLAVMRARQLVDGLLAAGAARSSALGPQELTPALRELAEEGVEAFAATITVPPPSDDERAALEAEEAELAALAGLDNE